MFFYRFISRRIERCKQKTIDGAQIIWDNFFKGGMLALISATVLWMSVFLYIVFYYYYMPSVSHRRPVNLQFKTCEEGVGMCSFPSAHVQLTKFQQLLMIGQTYRIFLKLEMPESQTNKDLGMFMVCAQLADKDGLMVSQACRSAMLHYRSELLTMLTTLTLYPLFIFGHAEEKQTLTLELYSDFEEDQNHPVTDVYIELRARRIEYYSASIFIQAHLKGLRYLMFHWPLVTAALGICSNLFFIVFIASVSWWQIFGPRDEYDDIYGEEFTTDDVDSSSRDSTDTTDIQQHEIDVGNNGSGNSESRSDQGSLTPGGREMVTDFEKIQ
ncbi:lipid droplet biogenesis associated protein seipin isoform X2 [Lycorma delicatula]|uniref:lipid droplet biogenesis associated protein seipin isoform X2 n=1 Tax=Lycorma delicatula TaxID=130591 RepID=UPI003F512B60